VIVAPSPQNIDDRDAENPSGASINLISGSITQTVALEHGVVVRAEDRPQHEI